MGLYGRYFSARDMKLVNSFNAELLGDIVQTLVIVYKIAPSQTTTNIYGEASPETGKFFYTGIECTTWIAREDILTEDADFGPDRKQDVAFRFREFDLQLINIYPEVGDIIKFNNRYHEIDNVVQEQFLGGIAEKSLSIIVNTHYTRLSKINTVVRQT